MSKQPKSKPKIKLAIAIVAGVLLALGLIGGSVAAIKWYHSPEKVALDAVSHAIKAKSTAVDGEITVKASDALAAFLFSNLKLKLTNSTQGISNKTDIDATITFFGGKNIKLRFGEVITKDGVVYFKTTGLYEAYQKSFEKVADGLISPRGLESKVGSAGSPDATAEMIEVLDNQWWKVSIPDLIAKTSPSDKAYGELYSCAFNTASDFNSKYTNEFAALYKRHPFAKIAAYKGEVKDSDKDSNYYTLSNDPKEAAAFFNAIDDTNLFKDFSACAKKIKKLPQRVAKYVNKLPEFQEKDFTQAKTKSNLVIGINKSKRNFSHLYFKEKVQSSLLTITGSLHFAYSNQAAKFDAPAHAKDISKLINKLGLH